MNPLAAFALWAWVASQTPSSETVEVPGTKLKIELVGVPAGSGRVSPLGKPEELRSTRWRGFSIGARDVTWAEFQVFRDTKQPKGLDGTTQPTMGDSYFGQVGIPAVFTAPESPLTNIRWHSAVAYCQWLSRTTGSYFRLPTELEWEVAARAGSETAAPADPGSTAWSRENSGERTHPPGQKSPNALGLYDMLGNVWQYCLEPHRPPNFEPVLRGGCWNSPKAELRYGARQTVPWEWCDSDTNSPQSVWWLSSTDASQGFRVVRAAGPSDLKDRQDYASRVELRLEGGKPWKIPFGEKTNHFCRVTGEIRNSGNRTLDEVEVTVYYLDPKGRPHLAEITGAAKPGRATFGKGWPVMANSVHEDGRAQPLGPGEARVFAIDMPQTFDPAWDVDEKRFGARVTALRFRD